MPACCRSRCRCRDYNSDCETVTVTVTVTASVAVTCRGCNLICGTLITVVAALHFNLPRQAAQELNFFTTKCAYAMWYVQ